MFDTLLAIHIVIAILLIMVVLLQKSNSDGLGSLSGGGNSGFVSAKTAANFLTKVTVGLAALFFINSTILANLSTRSHKSFVEKIKEQQSTQQESLPLAK